MPEPSAEARRAHALARAMKWTPPSPPPGSPEEEASYRIFEEIHSSEFAALSKQELRRLFFLFGEETKYYRGLDENPPKLYCENPACRSKYGKRTVIALGVRDRRRRSPETGWHLPDIDTVSVQGAMLMVHKDDPQDRFLVVHRPAQLRRYIPDKSGTKIVRGRRVREWQPGDPEDLVEIDRQWYGLPVRIACPRCGFRTEITRVPPHPFRSDYENELAALLRKAYAPGGST